MCSRLAVRTPAAGSTDRAVARRPFRRALERVHAEWNHVHLSREEREKCMTARRWRRIVVGATSPPRGSLQIGRRIDAMAVDDQLEIEMRAIGQAGMADHANLLAG